MSTTTPVRPSSLQMAEKCARAPYLSKKYKESSERTRFGSGVDGQVTRILSHLAPLDADEQFAPEATKILTWLDDSYPRAGWEYFVQRRLSLVDPLTGEELTAGTPDLVAVNWIDGAIVVIDWKTKGQWWAGHLAAPDNNLQQLSYLAASWLELSMRSKIKTAKIILACFDDEGVTPVESAIFTEEQLFPIIDRIRAIPMVDAEGPEPLATKGNHCEDCYQRGHCSAYLLPGEVALTYGLPAFGENAVVSINSENVAEALSWIGHAEDVLRRAKKAVEVVEGQVNAYVKQNGPVVVGSLAYQAIPTSGRRSGATVSELEKRGLTDLIKPGKPGIRYDWKPLPKDGT